MYGPERLATGSSLPTQIALARVAFPIAVLMQYAYTFAFNYIPTAVRHAWAGNLMLIFAFLAILAVFCRPRTWSIAVLASCAVMVLCWGISSGLGLKDPSSAGWTGSVQDGLKVVSIFLLIVGLLSYPENLPLRLVSNLALASIVLGGLIALTGDAIVLSGEKYLAPITGRTYSTDYVGPHQSLGRHDSAMFIVANVIILDQLRQWRVVSPKIAWPVILFGAAIAFGYASRTALVVLATYYTHFVFYRYLRNQLGRATVVMLTGLAVVGVIAFWVFSGATLNTFSSGRISNYIHRWGVLAERDWDSLLFGTGLGTDAFVAPIWYWMVQNAHNDFIHTFIEAGIIGLVAIIVFLVALYSRTPTPSRGCFYGIVVSSAISNGLLNQATMIPYFIFAISVAYAAWSKQEMT